jgi:rhamnopyranosyl-N-acetylglucosaminyl-diphospho-decaprenol beta-1,3/1,4-galactofuranosyltransferase
MKKIAAIIVTYNRKELLLNNLNNCINQTKNIDKIFVIDNASTDGTFDFLSENGIMKNLNIEYIHLDVNIGGAGGFYTGLKIAFENFYDFFWMMDDDGCPDVDSLENLLHAFELNDKLDVVGPLIYCDIPNLSHSKYLVNNKMSEDISEIKKVDFSFPVHPFNGTLIKRDVIEKIGYPIKDLFIWGDEQEFRLRWLKYGFKEASYTKSNYYHPRNKLQFNKYFIFKTPKINENRKYLYYRNQAYIFKIYRNTFYFLSSIIWMVLSITFFEKHKIKSINGLIDGLRSDLSDPKIN